MADYKLVKYCRACKDRFVVDKSELKQNYCSACQNKLDDGRKSP
ncbi:MAG: hypothetical protein V1740_00360 [Candidatus Woesearchaeota archaeon]